MREKEFLDGEYMNTKQAAKYLGVHERSIHMWIDFEGLPFYQKNERSRKYYKKEELKAWFEARNKRKGR